MLILRLLLPVLIGIAFVVAMSLVRDPATRLRLNAAITLGASGTYLAAGTFGPWDLVACTVVLVCAFRGLRSWRWVGVAWLLHTALDVAHAVKGVDLLPWAPHSSLGCAICDPVIALWCFAGGRPLDQLLGRGSRRRSPLRSVPVPSSTALGAR